MLDRRKFTEALIRALPELEKDNAAIALAYSDVLQQTRVQLQNKEGRYPDMPADGRPVSIVLYDLMLMGH